MQAPLGGHRMAQLWLGGPDHHQEDLHVEGVLTLP